MLVEDELGLICIGHDKTNYQYTPADYVVLHVPCGRMKDLTRGQGANGLSSPSLYTYFCSCA